MTCAKVFLVVALSGIAAAVPMARPARASIPTIDAAQLTRHAETASTTVSLVPVTTQRSQANDGVKCAVTTGKAAAVSDPAVKPQSGAGARTIGAYAPEQTATPDPQARGATLARQTLFGSAGDVVAGLDASRASLDAAQEAFRRAARAVGTAPTVMGAIDMNSAAKTQNGLAWNGVIGSANHWVNALNAENLAATSDASRVAAAMRMTTPASPSFLMPFSR